MKVGTRGNMGTTKHAKETARRSRPHRAQHNLLPSTVLYEYLPVAAFVPWRCCIEKVPARGEGERVSAAKSVSTPLLLSLVLCHAATIDTSIRKTHPPSTWLCIGRVCSLQKLPLLSPLALQLMLPDSRERWDFNSSFYPGSNPQDGEYSGHRGLGVIFSPCDII